MITGLGSGGAEHVLARITLASRPYGVAHRVIALTTDDTLSQRLTYGGIEVASLQLDAGVASTLRLREIPRVIRSWKPDVLMTWMYHADLVGTLAALVSGFPLSRVVWNIRCSAIPSFPQRRSTAVLVSMLARASTLPGMVVFNSRSGERSHREVGYKPKRSEYTPNGVDLEGWRTDMNLRSDTRRRLDYRDSDVVIGMVARVDPYKDHDTLFNSVEKLVSKGRKIQLLLVGKGTEGLQIPSGIASFVRAVGQQADVRPFLAAMDLHVLSSLSEGFPNVLLEAMAMSVPCVTTDVGDAASIIGATGSVVPIADCAAMTRALETLTDESADARRRRRQACRERVESSFSLDVAVERYIEIWQVLGNRT